MADMDLNDQLLQMIHNVSQAADAKSAAFHLLHPLLLHLDMDQAVFCELKANDEVVPIFGMDRTKQILSQTGSEPWLSRTWLKRALATMEPVIAEPEESEREAGGIPKSVHQFSLKHVIVLPVSREPQQLVYLASRRIPDRSVSPEVLQSVRTAAKAAVLALQQQRHLVALREQNKGLAERLHANEQGFLYASPELAEVVREVERVAPFNVTLLLQGESGTGKEEIAKHAHQASGRTGKFIAVNCANLTETLLESELFGHARGAFTGAQHAKLGLLQEADRGTFFLDEIGELPLQLQAKLLRVLQERCVRPLGGNADIAIDVRFVAASHRDLGELVAQGKFREDLLYRIQEMTVRVPPLRSRPVDAELLAKRFVARFSKEFGMPARQIGKEAMARLLTHPWPGNVRELKNCCRTAVILSSGTELGVTDFRLADKRPMAAAAAGPRAEAALAPETAAAAPTPAADPNSIQIQVSVDPSRELSLRELTEDFEREVILRLLARGGATQAVVARQLGISLRTLQRSVH